MTTAFLIYIALSLLFGGMAATYEIWEEPVESQRADGRGTYKLPKDNPISVGLAVAILWPLLWIGVLLDAVQGRSP